MFDLRQSTLLTFIEEIRNNPDDVALSPQLADYLEEHGATTGQVIHLYAAPPIGSMAATVGTYHWPAPTIEIQSDICLQKMLIDWVGRRFGRERQAKIAYELIDNGGGWYHLGCEVVERFRGKDRACREIKRRTLKEFDEDVSVTLSKEVKPSDLLPEEYSGAYASGAILSGSIGTYREFNSGSILWGGIRSGVIGVMIVSGGIASGLLGGSW